MTTRIAIAAVAVFLAGVLAGPSAALAQRKPIQIKRPTPEQLKELAARRAGELRVPEHWCMSATSPIVATLKSGNNNANYKGRVSLALRVYPEEKGQARVKVEALNVVLFEVDQQLLTGKQPRRHRTGVLGFSLANAGGAKGQALQYDPDTRKLTGKLSGFFDYPQIQELTRPVAGGDKGNMDHFDYPRVRGSVGVNLKLDKPLSFENKERKADTYQADGGLELIVIEPKPLVHFLIFQVGVPKWRTQLTGGYYRFFWNWAKLKIQPVRVRSSTSDNSPTGAGLAFGKPGANTQWGKVGIRFEWLGWKTVTEPDLKVVTGVEGTTTDEENDLKDTVDDDDAIEVFFIQNFDPVDVHGGGATWGSGTASAKIISSDGNATNGVDLTHLAHELGHVVDLAHPGSSSTTLTPGTPNTLMCPSGWNNDNPARNSTENGDNADNPLLEWQTSLITGQAPDCTDSSDCGSCP